MMKWMVDGEGRISARVSQRLDASRRQPHSGSFQHVGGNGRVSVHVAVDTSLARTEAPDQETFEQVWEQRPASPALQTIRLVDDRFFLKCRHVPSWADVKAIRTSGRVVHEARFLERMCGAGVSIPRTLAWGEERRFGIPVRSFLLTRAVRGARSLREFMRTAAEGGRDRASVLRGVGELVWRLHSAGLYHRDLSTRNLLVGEDGRLFAIDCPRGIANRLAARHAALRRGDLLRLGHSLLRDGASEAELSCVFEMARVDRRASLLAAVLRRAEERERSWRNRLWVMGGF
jgi:tRNA A-37 threonylcarbamoyl transferase component Bud32